MTPKIYILLPVHNRKEITRGFVECLQAQTLSDFQLILIDDGSVDGTADMVRERIPSTVVLRGTGTWWWAGSLQRGLDWLKGQDVADDALVLFINDDVRFSPDYLEAAVRVMKTKNRTLVLSRFSAPPTGEVLETGVCADPRYLSFSIAKSPGEINCLSTRGLFAQWRTIQELGGFRPRLLPHYLSDYEYTMRAHNKGIRCETSAELVVSPDMEATGYHDTRVDSLAGFRKKYLSKKSADNLLYWSAFAVLASRPRWRVFPNLARIVLKALKSFIRAIYQSKPTCVPR